MVSPGVPIMVYPWLSTFYTQGRHWTGGHVPRGHTATRKDCTWSLSASPAQGASTAAGNTWRTSRLTAHQVHTLTVIYEISHLKVQWYLPVEARTTMAW